MSIMELGREPMPFGKYKGKLLDNVPTEYLLWLLDSNIKCHGVLQSYLKENEEIIRKEGACDATESDIY